ncbi:hypothetical protein RB195_013070 [Necator americanus]|uniref:Uncharacterized protein n=1 Tax=Necator americanus TaxID=51031 RepID=A0ABR1DTU3_NECAM
MGGSIMGGHSYKRVGQRSVCVIRLLRLPDCCGREVWFVVIQRRIRTADQRCSLTISVLRIIVPRRRIR